MITKLITILRNLLQYYKIDRNCHLYSPNDIDILSYHLFMKYYPLSLNGLYLFFCIVIKKWSATHLWYFDFLMIKYCILSWNIPADICQSTGIAVTELNASFLTQNLHCTQLVHGDHSESFTRSRLNIIFILSCMHIILLFCI